MSAFVQDVNRYSMALPISSGIIAGGDANSRLAGSSGHCYLGCDLGW